MRRRVPTARFGVVRTWRGRGVRRNSAMTPRSLLVEAEGTPQEPERSTSGSDGKPSGMGPCRWMNPFRDGCRSVEHAGGSGSHTSR